MEPQTRRSGDALPKAVQRDKTPDSQATMHTWYKAHVTWSMRVRQRSRTHAYAHKHIRTKDLDPGPRGEGVWYGRQLVERDVEPLHVGAIAWG